MSKLYIFNTTICPTVGLTYHTRLASEATARDILETFDGEVVSAIGHLATAQVASAVLGRVIFVNRIAAEMLAGDQALCIKLRGRAPEGVILDRAQMDEIGYDIVHMFAVGHDSPAAVACHHWTDPEAANIRPDPPSLEFTVPLVIKRLDYEIKMKVEAQVQAGIACRGDDPAGVLRQDIMHLCRQVVHTTLDHRITLSRRLRGEVTESDLRGMRDAVLANLMEAITTRGPDLRI